MENDKKPVVVSGMRPTGRLHLGNYWGALKNWVELQEKYDCWFFVADWHALTTSHEETVGLRENTRLMVADWLAAGLDPAKCVMFRQSDVKAHAELYMLMGMITPISWLLRNPTFKEQLQELYKAKYKGQEDKMKKAEGAAKQLAEAHGHNVDDLAIHSEMATYGFLGYPVLQAADIAMYGANFVPVGKDQLPHLELTREIARRFNHIVKKDIIIEPEPLLTSAPMVPGLDARKMSKSYGNAIEMGEEPKVLEAKIKKMYTDPLKIKADDKGHPEGCVVCAFHKLYNTAWKAQEEACREGRTGCGACKKQLLELMSEPMAEQRSRRAIYGTDSAQADNLLEEGGKKAVKKAEELMRRIRVSLKLEDFRGSVIRD
ncbi:MAG: tryptophan--tRNA ligase [Elusimicrobia bacterium]|nr:tryptophan--tRNA ligase [Elusimicrobiota bacterium]